jgi:hypothetical protein
MLKVTGIKLKAHVDFTNIPRVLSRDKIKDNERYFCV